MQYSIWGKKKTYHFTALFVVTNNYPELSCFLESDDLKPNLKSDKQIAINLRLGVVLPKRRVKHSVCRNLIKRWVKELLKSSEMCVDIVIRVNCPVSIKTKQEKNIIFNELKTLLASVSAEYEKII